MGEVRIPAHAKINLRLDVLGQRADGYHELRTIFQTITLHDDLRLRATARAGISLTVQGNERLASEPVERNLVYRAVEALQKEFDLRSGVEIELRKRIPAGGGLGGGSSNAAAALVGYLRLTGRKLALPRLMEIAAGLGADVPFFLLGGRAVGVNRGDEIYPLQDIPRRTVVVVVPHNTRVPTADAFRWLEAPALTNPIATSKLWEFCALSWSTQAVGLSNDFEGPVFQRFPRLEEIKRVLLRGGAAEALLAGSGSAVFGIFPSPAKARRAVCGFPNDQTFVCETLSRERYLRAMKRPV
ncbi:MAG TPA: 4-(cytidine 5'-diphospho)-2-C-methyl-D-erythritol kinase [Candidatus Acidoferrales bacterium]|nr:4-(cytidine 5'-diphospho)-2-C-methyl-D-erythritol kinase [Candidatus Acidoferrales bacterium]